MPSFTGFVPGGSSGGSTPAASSFYLKDPEVLAVTSYGWGIGAQLDSYNAAIPVTIAPGAANLAILVPFVVNFEYVIKRLWWINTTAVAGNTDVAVYNSSFVKLIGSGATAQAGTNTLQSVDVADTTIAAGKYFMAHSSSESITGRFLGKNAGSSARLIIMGCAVMAAGHPLPDPFVPESVSSVATVPVMGITSRTSI